MTDGYWCGTCGERFDRHRNAEDHAKKHRGEPPADEEEFTWVDPDEFAAMQDDAIPAAVDWTARADIVSLTSIVDIVTRFLSEQFPDEWGTPPADVCGRVSLYDTRCTLPAGHDSPHSFPHPPADESITVHEWQVNIIARETGAEWERCYNAVVALLRGTPPADVCPDCDDGVQKSGCRERPCPSCGGTGDRPAVNPTGDDMKIDNYVWCEHLCRIDGYDKGFQRDDHCLHASQSHDDCDCPGPHRPLYTGDQPAVTDAERDAAIKAWEALRSEDALQYGGARPPLPSGAVDVILKAAAVDVEHDHDEDGCEACKALWSDGYNHGHRNGLQAGTRPTVTDEQVEAAIAATPGWVLDRASNDDGHGWWMRAALEAALDTLPMVEYEVWCEAHDGVRWPSRDVTRSLSNGCCAVGFHGCGDHDVRAPCPGPHRRLLLGPPVPPEGNR